MKMDFDEKTQYFLNVAMCSNNYAQYLKVSDKKFSDILGILYRSHQDKLRKISPQGVALLISFLLPFKESEYGNYIEKLNEIVDIIIEEEENIEGQFKRLEKYK